MTKAGARLFLHAGFATAALLLFAAASSRAETLDQFYEKAKLEKTLVFYSGGPAAPHENRAKEFMQKYPGIAVSVTGGFSNVLNERIERQIADRKLEVDMAFFQTKCRTSSPGRRKASCSHSSQTASIRSCRTFATRTALTWR